MVEISREIYGSSFGPTTGDRIRLADTNLFIEITEDRCAGGDEAVFGGGKSIRESMGQSCATRADGTPDLVITGAIVLDHWGVIKADVGIRDGRITALGKAGNPETMDGVHPDLVIGPSTEVAAGNGMILTAGTVDTHVHFVDPAAVREALGAGTTTVVGGGTGPTEGSKATLATPGSWWTERMLQSFEPWPVNVLFLARGNTVSHEALWEQLRGGAAGFKVHEDWGATPAVIDAALTWPTRPVSRWPSTATPSTRRVSSRTCSPQSTAGPSMPSTPKAPAAGMPRTSSASRESRTCCRPRPIRRDRSPTTPSPNTWTW